MAFEGGSETISYYLDIETGEIISVSDDERGLLENIYELYYDEQTQTVDWEVAFKDGHIPDWQRERIKDVDRVESGFGSRFIAVPSESSQEGYRDKEAIIDTVRNPRLRDRLERAIGGRGAFRYFTDVLLDYPIERERWFTFKQERFQQRIREWLEYEGISLANDPSMER
jgi:hypothetical protein